MKVPNPVLMAAYGTGRFFLSNLEKQADLHSALSVAAPLSSMALWQADQAHLDRQMAEAEMLNQMFREEEAERQAPVEAGFRGERVMSPQGQAAGQLNQMAAYQSMLGLMDKRGSADWAEAFGQTLAHKLASAGGMDKEAIGLVGGLLSGAKSLLAGGATRRLTQAAVQAGAAPTGMAARALAPASARAAQAVGGAIQKGTQAVGRGLQGTASGVQQGAQNLAGKVKGLGAPKMPSPAVPSTPKPLPVGATPKPPVAAAPPAAPMPPPTPAVPAAAPAGQPGALSRAWQAVQPGWRTKALLGAGIAGTGYVGYKGLQTARDYMMMPSHGAANSWGGSGLAPAGSVTEYGYAPHMG